jgi:murein biosynthesis integral membrane protein MurJ
LLALVREQLFAARFGTGAEALAFGVAGMLPRTLLDAIFASAVSASFIPVFNERLERKGRREAYRFAHNFITITMLLAVVVTIVAALLAKPAVGFMLGDNIGADTRDLTRTLFLIMLPTIVLSVAAYSLIGVLQSLGEFNIPAAMSVASNVAIIAYYPLLFEKFGIRGLAAAFVAGWLSQILIQVPFLRKNGFGYRPAIDLRDGGIKEIAFLTVPVMVSTWAQPVNLLVNVKVANGFNPEWAPALNFANALYSMIGGVFVLSISNVIFTRLSKATANNDGAAFGEILRETLRSALYLLLPMTGGLIVISKPLIQVIFERGVFSASSTALTVSALVFYTLGMPGYGLQTLLSRGFYASKNARTPMITGVLAIVLNAALSGVFARRLGVGGPALASSVSITVVAVIMLAVTRGENNRVLDGKLLKDASLMTAAAVVTSLFAAVSLGILSGALPDSFAGRAASVGVTAAVGATVYFILTFFLKISEAQTAARMARGVFAAAFIGRRGR